MTRTASRLLTTGLLTLSTGLGGALAGGLTAGTAHAASPAGVRWATGRSHPVEDSYYPTKGDPGVDTLHYHLDLTWRPRHQRLHGVARIVLRATHQASGFQLDLGSSLHVAGVQVDGREVHSSHVGKTLHVQRPVRADQRYRVRIDYAGTPEPVKAPTTRTDMHGLGWHTTKDGQAWSMQEPFGAFTWYPCNDQPSDKALYDVRLDVPGRWVGITNGRMTSRRHVNGRTVTRFHSSDPMASYLTTVAIGPYRRVHQTGPHGLPINYWVPRGDRSLVAPLRRTPGELRWLERRLGPYPFDQVGIVVVPSASAMETQTMITLGRANFRYGVRNVRSTVVHELSHAWYGDTVTPKDWRDVWMNEGMAMYVETRFRASQGWTTWRHWEREWRRDDQFWRDIYGPPGRYHRGEFASINVYYCPALMYDRLRLRIGDQRFGRLMRAWPQQHLDTNQTRATFEAWWEHRTGRDLGRFFRRWLMSRHSPA